jgi:hypothetical protein
VAAARRVYPPADGERDLEDAGLPNALELQLETVRSGCGERRAELDGDAAGAGRWARSLPSDEACHGGYAKNGPEEVRLAFHASFDDARLTDLWCGLSPEAHDT